MKRIDVRLSGLITLVFLVIVSSCSSASNGMGKRPAKRKPLWKKKTPRKHRMAPEYFALCTAALDGKGYTEILKDPRRQMSHARVSNDHQWITFMRLNRFNRAGIAVEEDGYRETEIMLCRMDGSDLQALVPAKKGIVNANGYWTPDNKGILYVSTDTPTGKAQLFIIDIATRKKKLIPTPPGINAADPHMVGDLVVYAARKKGKKSVIHIINSDGTNDRQVSQVPQGASHGEYDPKLSPDKSKVTFLRWGRDREKGKVDVIVVDLKAGKETNLSPPGSTNIDALPEWSSDGKRLVFWHLDRKQRILKSGLYTMRPDGSDRRKIPLPLGYAHSMPSFFPVMGSGQDAKVIFATRKFSATMYNKLKKQSK